MFNITYFEEIVSRIHEKLISYNDICTEKSAEETWSISELVSHLIDSASNNHQRFIRLQIEKEVHFPEYDAEEWKGVSKANDINYLQMVALWKLFNAYLLELIKKIDTQSLKNVWNFNNERRSLEFLVHDYYEHLLWHENLFEKIERTIRANTI